MHIDDFDYILPDNLIAQKPLEKRDDSRLLVYSRKNSSIEHDFFYNLKEHLRPGDLLIINHSKVMPARLYGKNESGRIIEFLLLKRIELDIWEVLVKPGKKYNVGDRVTFGENNELRATCLDVIDSGERIVQFYFDGVFEEVLDLLGEMPLPPYIKERLDDQNRYQTVYYKTGESAAAPTAGLHFTRELINELENKGIEFASLLLNVGLGTFRPIKTDKIEDHKMHSEYFEMDDDCFNKIIRAKSENRRVIAVGTTSVRVLETVFSDYEKKKSGWTEIFIKPGYTFKVVDGLITNFHLPKSTLIMLVSAFVGNREKTLNIYEQAVEEQYRFFSFGDSMFIF